MSRLVVLAVLVGFQTCAVIGVAVFHRVVRPELLDIVRPPMPIALKLALSNWLLPSCAALGVLVSVAALFATGRKRLVLLSTGVTITALPAVAAVLVAYAALLS
jgi:hypothetical protein